jgi:hypothetical protein
VLESFHYASDRMMRRIRTNRQKIFLDSGAFSMFTRNADVDLRAYADFIRRNNDIITAAANLDVIGPGNEELSYARLKVLERMLAPDGLSHLIQPVHHVRDRDRWLRTYLDDGYDRILLGGMVPETMRTRRLWLDRVFEKYLINPDGSTKVRVHGFGLGSRQLMLRYPFYSIDTTDWVSIRFGGAVLLDCRRSDGSIKDRKVLFSDRYDSPLHYRNLGVPDRRAVDHRLEQLEAERVRQPEIEADFKAALGCPMGFNAKALSRSYGLRHLCNIGYFSRAMRRGVDRFDDRRSRVWPNSVKDVD